MSGGAADAALTFLVSGAREPTKVINVNGSVQYRHHRHDGGEPAVSVLSGHLTNTTDWDPPLLTGNGGVTITKMGLLGVQKGDVVSVGLSSVAADDDTTAIQLTATAGDDIVKIVLQNVGEARVDIPQGRLRLVVAKML
jgi:hypothetical protein